MTGDCRLAIADCRLPTGDLPAIAKQKLVFSLAGRLPTELDNFLTLKKHSHKLVVVILHREILQFETTYGDTDLSTYDIYYPDLTIDKVRREDSVKLYTIDNGEGIKFKLRLYLL